MNPVLRARMATGPSEAKPERDRLRACLRPASLPLTLAALLCAAAAAACRESSGPNAAFTVYSVSPGHGPTAGGTAIAISGSQFPATVDSVRVGTGLLNGLVRVASTELTGTTPTSGVPGSADVTVYAVSAGVVTCPACFTYVQYQPTLTVRQILPSYGSLAGGTDVMIYGDFPAVSAVRLGAGSLVDLSGQRGVAVGTTPPGSAPGPVDVTVYSDDGGYQYGTCAGCFTYHSTDVIPHYSVAFLGAGADSSQAVDINDSGTVVGLTWSALSGPRGRLWPSAGIATDLDTILPVAINDYGTVLGCLGTIPNGTQILWENGATRSLSGLGTYTAHCGDATDINNRGQVALLAPGGAYLWQNNSLTPLQAGGAQSLHRMNGRGEVAGSIFNSSGGDYGRRAAVLGTGATRVFGGGESEARAVNDAGFAVGQVYTAMGFGWRGGYLWGVGPLPFNPTALNDSLQIVGGAWIWQDSAEASLTSRLTGTAWQISGAVAINDRGQIAAYGVNTVTGQRGAVRLDPVPSSSGARAARGVRP